MSTSPLSPEEIRAAAEAHRELGPEYSDAVVASFIEKVDKEIAARVDARLAGPPRTTPEAQAKLQATIAQLAAVRPDYFSITHGAGGSDQEGTYETLLAVVEHSGAEAAPHLTCVGSTQ